MSRGPFSASRLAAALCCAGLAAQEVRERDTATEQALRERQELVERTCESLRSKDAKDVAWAARTAAEQRLTECADELRAALRRKAAPGYVLDALVEIDAKVPPAELEPFARYLAAVVAMLRNDDAVPAVMRVFATSDRGFADWRACGNRLAVAAPEDFVVHLLTMPIELQFHVGSVDAERFETSGVRTSSGRALEGWPPLAVHDWSFEPGNGARLVVDGPFPVFVRRTLTARTGNTKWGRDDASATCRVRWLEHMLGDAKGATIPSTQQAFATPWTDAASLVERIAAQRSRTETEWQVLADACVRKEILIAGRRAALTPPISIRVLDRRPDRSEPLSDLK